MTTLGVWGSSAAVAQTGYPGSTTSTTAGPTEARQTVEIQFEGDFFINEACGFKVGTSARVEANGVFVADDSVDADGCVRHRVDIVDVQQAVGRPLVAAVNSLLFAQQRSDSVTIRLLGRTLTFATRNVTLVVSGTGVNGQPRRVFTSFTVNIPPAGGVAGELGRGALARTGVLVAQWVTTGTLLVLTGVALVRFSRRRRRYTL